MELSRNNPASRIAELLDGLASNYASGPRMLDAWIKTFRLDENQESDESARAFEVFRLLRLADAELRTVEATIASRFASVRYAGHILLVRNAMSFRSLLDAPQNHAGPAIGAPRDVMHTLGDTLFQSENSLSADELETARHVVAEFRKKLKRQTQDGSLTIDIASFIESQIELMERAIRDYAVIGAEAFRNSSLDAALSYARRSDIDIDGHDDEKPTAGMSAMQEWHRSIYQFWKDLKEKGERRATRLVLVADVVSHLLNGGQAIEHYVQHQLAIAAPAPMRALGPGQIAADATATRDADSHGDVRPDAGKAHRE